MNDEVSLEMNGDMIVSPETGGAIYFGRVDSSGDIHLLPGGFEISEDEVVEAIIARMNEDPHRVSFAWNKDFTVAAVKAGEKERIPAAYLLQARIEEYREPSITEWWAALDDAWDREGCTDADGNLTCSFWTDGVSIWATPVNVHEPGARRLEFEFEAGVGYTPVDL